MDAVLQGYHAGVMEVQNAIVTVECDMHVRANIWFSFEVEDFGECLTPREKCCGHFPVTFMDMLGQKTPARLLNISRNLLACHDSHEDSLLHNHADFHFDFSIKHNGRISEAWDAQNHSNKFPRKCEEGQ